MVGPNVLRWTFPIGGTPTKESRLVQLIIGSIMVVSQATIVYLEWLLAPSRKLEDTGGIVTAGCLLRIHADLLAWYWKERHY